jgi:hypothetical protein
MVPALIAGIAVAFVGTAVGNHFDWLGGPKKSPGAPEERASSDASVFTLEQLETALETEVKARTELAERIAELEIELSALKEGNQERSADSSISGDSPNETESPKPQPDLDLSTATSGFDDEALLSRGIHPREVARLRDLWESHEFERADISNRALREGWFFAGRHRNELAQLDRDLREDLPDEEYDRYLYALGEPNRLKAGDVLRGSTASEAGLQRGDFILRYGDVRVFKPGELLLASSQGEPGDSVPVLVLRDGTTRTVHMRRGPLGVMIEPSRGEPLLD